MNKNKQTTERGLIAMFAVASGLCVANVYYAQPLLDALAQSFAISQAAVGGVVTATQVGSALALLLLVPLGDIVERRRLLLVQLLALMVALSTVALAQSAVVLLTGMLATGLLGTAMTQGLIASAASIASERERGRVVGAAQGGVFIGLLLARIFAGVISDLAGWRAVYGVSALLMMMLLLLLRQRLPVMRASAVSESWFRLMSSMLVLLCTDRVLQIRGVLALLMFAAFNIFWSAMVLPLSAAPFGFSHTAIGLFALAGVAGALVAARAGKEADRGNAQRTSLLSLLLLLLAWWPLSRLEHSLVLLILGIVLLDFGGQALHVTNQSLLLRTNVAQHGRLVALYMLFYATGSGLGAMATTVIYAGFGWQGVCLLGATVSLLALIFWATTRRWMRLNNAP
ncbi:UNVERIFIED_ORG: putative MFS family arabinose efflux permease [Kosakonia oryzae]|uniref:Predicted arabinose efflux permease, MFS family n=1 Tax=Kosakonia radicincitans TaxID=283686 RepID=A0AAX2EMI4_9ENTR|nr:MFS transporter [Kosakonia radicincitans]MDP9564727.1 putative MFS family arabinose efflux permease [Kosakonia oryzae]SFD97065.1 Predicted arabinose efflux permease, MFS family [Kosakonia radicincitans]SFQ99181.1 Predicted arabinose efflux permease, MFS family [Kosakonia radicincitans]SFT45393.1 Predicted arabinose efflux permease, MFS family [Kosakonia radicincitans]SFX15911.1 Predicted arabinose efflux permease, MFS family [Kosakonia radicincitans]